MSTSRIASVLLRSRCFGRRIVIIFASITALVLSFQPPKKNRAGHQNVRQSKSDFRVDYRLRQNGWASSSLSPFIRSNKGMHLGILRLDANQGPSHLYFTQQNRSAGAETNSRDMSSLSKWSRSCEIVLADGIELSEDLLRDWSLTTTKSIVQGSSIMTVPSHVILTSGIDGDSYLPYYDETDMRNIYDWMESELESGSQSKQDYLAEYMLVYKLIREVHLDTKSRWYPWLQSLPTQFSTGLYLDEVERNHVERMTGDYIRIQGLQYQACSELFQKLVSKEIKTSIPTQFLKWVLALQEGDDKEDTRFDNLIKWAFTIVFTRSWRSPDRKEAQIVPLGDLANHDSQFANLKPGFRQTDGAFQFFATNDIEVGGSSSPKLYLSYGLTYAPARYLVLFGFCDVTAAYIDAQLDFFQLNDECKWPTTLEPSQLVVSTLNGALSEDVWIAFLYKILQESYPEELDRIRNVFDDSEERGDVLIQKVLETWEFEVGMEIQAYYQLLLETDFAPIPVTEKDLAEHPRLSMIVNYNLFIRETYLNVLQHVNVFLTQCNEFQKLSILKKEIEVDTITPRSGVNTTFDFRLNSSEGSNQTSFSLTSGPMDKKSKDKPFQSVSKKFVSVDPSHEDATDTERENNPPLQKKYSNISAQKVQETGVSNVASSFSTESLDQQSPSVEESQEIIDFNTLPEPNDKKTGQLASSQSELSQKGSNLNTTPTSRFSFENFSLESYSNATPKANDGDTNPPSFFFNQTMPRGIDKTVTTSIPTEESSTELYSGGQIRPTTGEIESHTSPFATSKFPEGNLNQQSYFPVQPSQVNIDSVVTPQFDYGNSNLQSYSDDLTPPSQEQIDSTVTPKFPSGNSNLQSFSLDQPSQEDVGLDVTTQIDGWNSNSQSLYNDPTASRREKIYSTVNSSLPDTNAGSQSCFDGQTTPAQERIDSTVTSGFSNTHTPLQSNPNGPTTPMQERTESTATSGFPETNTDSQSTIEQKTPTQDAVDMMTSYAQSLVSDQRGCTSEQQQSGGGTQFSKQKETGISSTPTTYAEYIQQRQEESNSTR